MTTFFRFVEELEQARKANGTNDIFGVEYHSVRSMASRNYVMFKTEQEFQSWKAFMKEWDYIINRLGV